MFPSVVAMWCTMFFHVLLGLEMFKQKLEIGRAGDQLGALVRGVKREDVKRGMVLCPPGSVLSHTQLKAQVCVCRCFSVYTI